MAQTVGAILLNARELVPDLPAKLATPLIGDYTLSSAVVGAATLIAGTYICKLTLLNAFGETDPSAESGSIVVDATHGIRITNAAAALPVGVTAVRVYFGIGAGLETQYQDVTAFPTTIIATGTYGTPPAVNRAWNPDASGGFAGVHTVYRWLNEGLSRAAKLVGGIQDFTAVQSTNQVGMYTLPGQWIQLRQAWFDGFPIALGGQSDIYRKNTVTGQTGVVALSSYGSNTQVEIWPQSNRTGVSTTLNNGGTLSATATSATLTTVTSLLPSGIVQIGSEKIAYDYISGNAISGLTRGINGTTAASHADASAVTELNLRFAGLRMPDAYAVGDSAKTLNVPPAWEALLPLYILYKFKLAEQSLQEAQGLLKEFETEMLQVARANRQVAGPIQIGGPSNLVDTYGGSFGGGRIIP